MAGLSGAIGAGPGRSDGRATVLVAARARFQKGGEGKLNLRQGKMIRALGFFLILGLAVGAYALFTALRPARATIRIDDQQTFQTFHDWEATAVLLGTQAEQDRRLELFDRMFQDIGVTRVRLETFAGAENPANAMRAFLAHQTDMEAWKAARYVTVNDNDDPFTLDPAGFDFFDLDYRVDHTVLPMLERARARGERLAITFTYVAFTKQVTRDQYIHTEPEEYAEFILASFLHLKEKYGIVPDYFEPLLEPDRSPFWDPVTLGRAVAAAKRRLGEAGFHPGLVLPSVADASLTLTWLDGIAQTPGALDGLSELTFHRYQGARPAVLKEIAARAAQLGVATGMLEYWFGKATHDLLFQDLTLANVSAWQPRAAYNFHKITDTGALVLQDEMVLDRLYFQAIRPGDVRIGALSDNERQLAAVAFRKPDGHISLVLEARKAAAGTIEGLPEGDYLVETAEDSGLAHPPVAAHVGADGILDVNIQAAGVISVRPAL